MPRPGEVRCRIRMVDYDGEYIDGRLVGSGGPLLVLTEWYDEWVEVDQWAWDVWNPLDSIEEMRLIESECGWCDGPNHRPGVHCPRCQHLGGDGSLPCDCGALESLE